MQRVSNCYTVVSYNDISRLSRPKYETSTQELRFARYRSCLVRPKHICVFQVSRPYLDVCPNPKHLIVNCAQNCVEYTEKWGKITVINAHLI